MVARIVTPFLVALKFLTVIPVPVTVEMSPRRTAQAMMWFPVIGLMIGGILALLDWALGLLFPPLVRAGLLLAAWVVLTGALHLDGFLDCCDGLLATAPPEKRLAILRDPHTGAYAIVGAVCLLLIKFTLLVELPDAVRITTLLIVPTLGRAAMVYAVRAFPYARTTPGLGQLFRDGLTWRHVLIAAAIAGVTAGAAMKWMGLVVGFVVWMLAVGIAACVRRRIGGLTGDVYGAINELTEVGGLLCMILIARYL